VDSFLVCLYSLSVSGGRFKWRACVLSRFRGRGPDKLKLVEVLEARRLGRARFVRRRGFFAVTRYVLAIRIR
jgi:hypothetical protein